MLPGRFGGGRTSNSDTETIDQLDLSLAGRRLVSRTKLQVAQKALVMSDEFDELENSLVSDTLRAEDHRQGGMEDDEWRWSGEKCTA